MTEIDAPSWRVSVGMFGVVIVVSSLLVAVERFFMAYGGPIETAIRQALPNVPVLAWAGIGIVLGTAMIALAVFEEVLWS